MGILNKNYQSLRNLQKNLNKEILTQKEPSTGIQSIHPSVDSSITCSDLLAIPLRHSISNLFSKIFSGLFIFSTKNKEKKELSSHLLAIQVGKSRRSSLNNFKLQKMGLYRISGFFQPQQKSIRLSNSLEMRFFRSAWKFCSQMTTLIMVMLTLERKIVHLKNNKLCLII